MEDVVLDRADALRSLEDVAAHRVTLVTAPEGYGKTLFVRALESDAFTVLEIRPDCTFERFVGDVVRHVGPLARGISRSIARVSAKALEREDGPAVLAAWFCRFLSGPVRVLVVDGVDAAEDPRIAAFLHAALQNSPSTVRWILVGRDVERIRPYVGSGEGAAYVGAGQLELTFPELKELANAIAPAHSDGDLFLISRKAAGSISRAVFLLRCLHFGIPATADRDTSLETLLDRCYANLSDQERLETMAGILLQDGGNVENGALATQVSSVFSRLRTTAPFLFEPGERSLQACFRARLRSEIRSLIAQNKTDLFIRAADALEANGDTASAIALYCAVDAVDRLLGVVERRGGIGLEGEQLHVLREAIDLMPEEVRDRHPLVVGLRGIDAANRGRHAEAAALFERGIRLSEPGDRQQSIRYWYSLLGASMRDARLIQRLLQPSVEFFQTPPPMRGAMMAVLGVSWMLAGNGERAANWIVRARTISDATNDDALAARVYQQAAFVAWRNGGLDEAQTLGMRAVTYAEAAGWPHIAAITYGLLFNIAVERDQHDQIGIYARGLADNSARAGNVTHQYMAVSACYEHAVVASNFKTLADLRDELAQFDVAGSPAAFLHGRPEMPGRALEFAWDGRFEDAYRLLEPLLARFDDEPSDATLELSAFAEAAVYAAAATMPAEANRAIRLYRASGAHKMDTPVALRAKVNEALALWLLSKDSEARLAMRGVFTHLPITRSRLRVYAELAATVIGTDEPTFGLGGKPLEDELYASGWGGLARLVRSVVAARSRGTLPAPHPREHRALG